MAEIGYAYTAHLKREAGHREKRYSSVKSSENSVMPTAHIPEGLFARQSMCGRPLTEVVEVEDGAQVKMCKVCQSRVQRLFQRVPGSRLLQEIFGNKLLPAADH